MQLVAKVVLEDCRSVSPTWARTADRPVPHPLDYFWGYGERSIGPMVDRLTRTTSPGDRIVYLGAPNAFDACADVIPDRSHVLLDRRDFARLASVGPNREFRRVDLLIDEVPHVGAKAGIVDPPWYPGEMRAFLWAAKEAADVGATLWASSPPAGTRPNVGREVASVLEWASRATLRLSAKIDAGLRYRSPPFELASHRAAGLGGVPIEWRSGDLLRLDIVSSESVERPSVTTDDLRWRSFEVNEIPICVKQSPAREVEIGEDLLGSVIEGDVLTSVSRRSRVRQEVHVWTSLNRVWSSSYPTAVAAICGLLAEGGDLADSVETVLGRRLGKSEVQHVRRVADHLAQVVRLEREEHGL